MLTLIFECGAERVSQLGQYWQVREGRGCFCPMAAAQLVNYLSVLSYLLVKGTHDCLIDRKIIITALAGVAQWIECRPVNQRVAGSIPSQGTCLGCGPGPQ